MPAMTQLSLATSSASSMMWMWLAPSVFVPVATGWIKSSIAVAVTASLSIFSMGSPAIAQSESPLTGKIDAGRNTRICRECCRPHFHVRGHVQCTSVLSAGRQ